MNFKIKKMEIYSESFEYHYHGEKNTLNSELDKMVQDSESLPKEWSNLQITDQVMEDARFMSVIRTLIFVDPVW
ncbi:MAG: hypothetical protein ACLFNO_03790 [Parcubacteria group bacterium]